MKSEKFQIVVMQTIVDGIRVMHTAKQVHIIVIQHVTIQCHNSYTKKRMRKTDLMQLREGIDYFLVTGNFQCRNFII